MTYPIRDPEGLEPKYLLEMGNISDAKVLEVGAGDGRLTWRYASEAKSVLGVDPLHEDLRKAITSTPQDLIEKTWFVRAEAESLPLASGHYDVVLLAWSL